MKLNISLGNSKMGKKATPNISLPAVITCRPDAPCTKLCYARRGNLRFPNVKALYQENLSLWRTDPTGFVSDLEDFLCKKRPAFFRWHVAGDIPDLQYYHMMQNVAKLHHETQFLAFSKRYEWVLEDRVSGFGKLPSNLRIKLSAWPGLDFPTTAYENMGFVYTTHKDENRAPEKIFDCPGYCPTCRECWNSDKPVLIEMH